MAEGVKTEEEEPEEFSDCWMRESFELSEGIESGCAPGNVDVKEEVSFKQEHDEIEHDSTDYDDEDDADFSNDDGQEISSQENCPLSKGNQGSKRQEKLRGSYESFVRKVLETATDSVNGLKNQCLFQCSKCHSLCKCWNHLRSHQNCDAKFKFSDVAAVIVKAVAFRCKICHERVLCDTRLFERHVHMHHKGLSLKNYREMHRADDPMTVVLANASDSENGLGSHCVFQCPACHFEASNWVLFAQHKQCGKTYGFADMPKVIAKAVRFKCNMCGETVLCDASLISRHVRLSHKGTSVKDYRSMHAGPDALTEVLLKASISETCWRNQCEFACFKCKKKFRSWKSLVTHEKSSLARKISGIREAIVTAVAFHCRLCQAKVLCDSYFIRRHRTSSHPQMSQDEYRQRSREIFKQVEPAPLSLLSTAEKIAKSKEVGNHCVFTCRKCKVSKQSWKALMSHFEQTGCTNRPFIKKCHLTKTVLYECPICKRRMLANRQDIYLHMYSAHITKSLPSTKS